MGLCDVIFDSGRALGAVKETKKGGFIRKYLIEGDNDAVVMSVHAQKLSDLKDDPLEMHLRYPPQDFAFVA